MARFYRSPTWKHILTTRDGSQCADLSRLASERRFRFELGGPSSLTGFVPADDPRVRLPVDDDFALADFDPWYVTGDFDYPRMAEGVRLLYSFRREGLGEADPWVIRHAGPVLAVEDEADPDRRLTRFTCMDAWALLYNRPCLVPTYDGSGIVTGGTLPNANGVNWLRVPSSGAQTAPTGDQIALELLAATIIEHGSVGIDAGPDFGGTVAYNGTVETTDVFVAAATGGSNESTYRNVAVNFPPGTTVGEAWEQLVDTGTMDIILTPIWDPASRPGYTHEVSIYNIFDGGAFISNFASFNWDRSGSDLIRINRIQEGRERANKLQFYGGQSGVGGKVQVALQTDAQSVARFGQYWHLGQLTRQTTEDKLVRMAQDELFRRRVAHRAWRLYPTPEFAPRPFQDYMPGSFVSFYHSDNLREEQWWLPNQLNNQGVMPRVFGYSIDISDDSLETVTELDISLDLSTIE